MVPKIHYAFVPIADIEAKPVNATIDVVGVVSGISETSKITSKRTGADLVKRMMHVADDSGKSIELTLWGGTAERFPMEEGAVVAFKGLRVTEWNTKSLNSGRDCSFEVNPDIDATARLQAWASEGGASAVTTISVNERGAGGGRVDTWSTLGEMLGDAELASDGDKPQYATVRSYISKINPRDETPMWFSSCPKCSKKAVGDDTSGYNCESCGWSGEECSYRYLLQLVAVDASGSQWLTAFNDQATAILGKPAEELKRLRDTSPTTFEEVLQRATWQPMSMVLRSKKESWQGNARVKMHVQRPNKTNFSAEGKMLLAEIAKYGDLTAAA